MGRKISYVSAIKKILKGMNSGYHLTPKAVKFINIALNALNNELIAKCIRDKTVTLTSAERAVKSVCVGKVEDMALTMGIKTVFLFNTGFFHYKETTVSLMNKRMKDKKRQEKMDSGYQFKKGVATIAKFIAPGMSLRSDANLVLCKLLIEIAKKVSDEVKSLGQGEKSITHQEVRTSVINVMPEEIQRHALAEGAKLMFYIETGKVPLQAPVRKSSRKEVGRKEAKKRKPTSKPRKAKRLKVREQQPTTKRGKRIREPSVGRRVKREKLTVGEEAEAVPPKRRRGKTATVKGRATAKAPVERKRAATRRRGTKKRTYKTKTEVKRKRRRASATPEDEYEVEKPKRKRRRRKAEEEEQEDEYEVEKPKRKRRRRKAEEEEQEDEYEVEKPKRKRRRRKAEEEEEEERDEEPVDDGSINAQVMISSIKKLCRRSGVRNLSPEGLELIVNTMVQVCFRMTDTTEEPLTIGPKEIRSIVFSALSEDLQNHALARMSQALATK